MKDLLKTIKLNENSISMFLGAVVVIVAGLLVVNYFRNLRTSPSIERTGVQDQRVALPAEHTVAAGEYLWSIAEKYYESGFNWTDIAKENKLTNPNKLLVGQKLSIPKVESQANILPKTEVKIGESQISGDSYQVARNDNLWEIAVRAYGDGYQWIKIARENKLRNPNLIHSGNSLILPR